jgi:phosphonate transport system permease protein
MARNRALVLLAIVAAGLWSAVELDLAPAALIPGEGGLELVGEFFSRALTPALRFEGEHSPSGSGSLPLKALAAAKTTVLFAAAATSLALAFALLLAIPAAAAFWEGDPAGGADAASRLRRRALKPILWGGVRVGIALMRSVHELLWAVLFLCAFGLTPLGAAVAIAIPYAGTLAKVFSEMIDEAPRDTAEALRAAGASPLQVFFFGLLPRALPDMGAYAFYRFECAIRSSAILGFFGIPTLGLFIRLSWENSHFGEVWTYLYALFALVVVADWWSGALRRRFVA